MRKENFDKVARVLRDLEMGNFKREDIETREDWSYFYIKHRSGVDLKFFLDAGDIDYLEKISYGGEYLEYEDIEELDDSLDMDEFEVLRYYP